MTEVKDDTLLAQKNRIRGAARARDFKKVNELWEELVEQEETFDREFYYEITNDVANRGDADQAGRLLFALLPLIEQHASGEEAFSMLRRVAALAPHLEDLREQLLNHYRKAYGHYPGLEAALKRTGLATDGPLNKAVDQLDDAFYFKEGDFVHHATGWGIGKVIEAQPETGDYIFDFEKKKNHRMAAIMARKSLERKNADDFSVLLWTNPERIRELSVEEPLELLKKALRDRGRPMVARDLREKLTGDGNPLKKTEWTKFWSKARRKAIRDPYVEIGKPPKCQMELRDEPVSREDEIDKNIAIAAKFTDRLALAHRELRNILDARKKNKDAPPAEEAEPPTWIVPALLAMDKDLSRKRKGFEIQRQAGRIELELFKAHVAAVFPKTEADLNLDRLDPKSIKTRAAADFPKSVTSLKASVTDAEGSTSDDASAAAADPTAGDPTASADPTAADPTAADPTAADPTAADPTAADPTAADPTAADPTADPTAADDKPAARKAAPAKRADKWLTRGVVEALAQAEDLPAVLREMSIDAYRKRVLKYVRYAWPESWLPRLIAVLRDPAIGLFEIVAKELVRLDAGKAFATVANQILIKPKQYPVALLGLVKAHFAGKFEEYLPDRSDYEMLMKHLSVLDDVALRHKAATEREEKTRLKAELEALKAMLSERSTRAVDRVIDGTGEDQARRMLLTLRQGLAISRTVMTSVERQLAKKYPRLLAKVTRIQPTEKSDDEGPILTTKEGLARKQDERQQLVEVDIPKNRIDLGNALAQGDISENAELDEARREQERLSNKLTQTERELGRARLIEFKKLTGNQVEVGCRVKIKNHDLDEVNEYTILGPWDTNEKRSYISYLSAVAQAVMGQKVGQKSMHKLPGAETETTFEVLEIQVPDPDKLFD